MRPIVLTALFILLITLSNAGKIQAQAQVQDVPWEQKNSIWAPNDIKIDGMLTEWGSLSAKSSANRMFYTVANDNKNLYVVIRAFGVWPNEKILRAGITFTVSNSTEKKARANNKNNISITFPLTDPIIGSKLNALQLTYMDMSAKEKATNQHDVDSIYNRANLLLPTTFTEIKVTGIKGIDTLISIYNDTGIKLAARFNNTMRFIYELAIPLKYLNLANGIDKFSYNIKLNAPTSALQSIDLDNPNANVDAVYRISPTDFWGEYTLAKKE